jgi:RNA polymerase sigma-70 factor (ECF subfamily)
MTSTGTHALAARLLAQRDTFKAFLAARVGSAAEAEDILQTGLVKALQRADELRDDDKLTAWFYQVLRRAVIDHYRTRGAERRRAEALGAQLAALEEDTAAAALPGIEAQLCSCLAGVIATLPPHYAQLLQRVELAGEAVQDAARALGVSANHASITLHRARRELRQRLEQFCGACADGACLDCDCAPADAIPSPVSAN